VTGVALEGWPTTGDTGENFVYLGGQQEAAALVPLMRCLVQPARLELPRRRGTHADPWAPCLRCEFVELLGSVVATPE
jgi:hypothetical protein